MGSQEERFELFFCKPLFQKFLSGDSQEMSYEQFKGMVHFMGEIKGGDPMGEEEIKDFFARYNNYGKQHSQQYRFRRCLDHCSAQYDMFRDEKDFRKIMEKAGFDFTIYEDQVNRLVSYSTMLFEKHDVSKTGLLSYEEFRAMLQFMNKSNGEVPEDYAKKFFNLLDRNQDGNISLEEIIPLLKKNSMKEFADEKKYKKMMEEAGFAI